MTLADVVVAVHDEGPVIELTGEVDLSNTDIIRTEIIDVIPHEANGAVLVLNGTTYLDSSGIRLLFELAERLQARRQRLVLVLSAQALVRRVIALTKLDDAVPVVAEIDRALELLR